MDRILKPKKSLSCLSAKTAIILCASMMLSLSTPSATAANSLEYEINRLISAVGRNGCTFIRNGERYRGRAAREHLRTKRELNEELIATTEDFIEKIASASETTGEPYLIQCRRQEERTVNEWFTSLLEEYRSNSDSED